VGLSNLIYITEIEDSRDLSERKASNLQCHQACSQEERCQVRHDFLSQNTRSHLRQTGIESEIVDLLQGSVPKSVFARHYFTPGLDYSDKVLISLNKLKQ
jgi:intergrase/recombinase